MSIHVNFFAGDSDAIRQCLDSGGWPPDLPASKCSGEVGFKFGIMPEQALDALIRSAAQLSNNEVFRFEDCVDGKLAQNGESFQGTVDGKFIEVFSEFPEQLVHDLSTRWTNDLGAFYESEFPTQSKRKRTCINRLGSGIQTAIFGAVMLPILATTCLIPSFRRERAMNKKKLATRKIPVQPTNDDLIFSLIQLCEKSRKCETPLIYTWHI